MNLLVGEKCVGVPAGSEGGCRQPAAGTQCCPGVHSTAQSCHSPLQTCRFPSEPCSGRPLGLCRCSFPGCPPLAHLPSKGLCVLCSLKGCLLREVSPGFPGWTQAPLLLCSHSSHCVVTVGLSPHETVGFCGRVRGYWTHSQSD